MNDGDGTEIDSGCDWSTSGANIECMSVYMYMCNSTSPRITRDGQLDRQQVSVNFGQENCPPWFYFDWETQSCQCMPNILWCKMFR